MRKGIFQNPQSPLELFNLATDPGETQNLAREKPDIAAKLAMLMKEAHSPSKEFPLPGENSAR